MDKEEVARHIVDSAVAIHTALGPGLLESVYQQGLRYELSLRGLDVRAEYPIPIQYKGIAFDCGCGCSIGFLINWKVSRIKNGIQRMIWHE
jgi:hypothetical protein